VFEAAEAEYIRAKMELHKKTDQKERLTEHLCVIIQENEVRKARKLAELMAKLEIDSGEYLDMARSTGIDR
jgi:RAB6-interacting golgin